MSKFGQEYHSDHSSCAFQSVSNSPLPPPTLVGLKHVFYFRDAYNCENKIRIKSKSDGQIHLIRNLPCSVWNNWFEFSRVYALRKIFRTRNHSDSTIYYLVLTKFRHERKFKILFLFAHGYEFIIETSLNPTTNI